MRGNIYVILLITIAQGSAAPESLDKLTINLNILDVEKDSPTQDGNNLLSNNIDDNKYEDAFENVNGADKLKQSYYRRRPRYGADNRGPDYHTYDETSNDYQTQCSLGAWNSWTCTGPQEIRSRSCNGRDLPAYRSPCRPGTPNCSSTSWSTCNSGMQARVDCKINIIDRHSRSCSTETTPAPTTSATPAETTSGLDACPMDERHSSFGCQCGSEMCSLFQPCAKFNTSKSFESQTSSNRSYDGYFDRNCPTESNDCITRCKESAQLCSGGDGYPISCTCDNGKRDVDDPAMCDDVFVKDMRKCTCPNGTEITELPDGEPFYAENVWRKPAND